MEYPEWGFPKGRRNYKEKDLIVRIREFEEETGYQKEQLIFYKIFFHLKKFLLVQIINHINIIIF